MKIRYENTTDDVIAYWRHNRAHSALFQKGLRRILFVPAAVFLAVGVFAAVDRQDPICIAAGAAIGLAWVAASWLFIRWLLRASERKLQRKASGCAMCRSYELELTDGTLEERTDNGGHATALQDVEKIASTESHTFIYVSPKGAYVIPRRCVPEGEYTAFVDAVRREWEQLETVAWRPSPAELPKESPPALTPDAAPTPLGSGRCAYYRSKPRPEAGRCRACGQPRPRGKFTCRLCGRTQWSTIVFLIVIAVVVKVGAVCGGLWLHNDWLNPLAAWGGSLIGGFFFLGAVGASIDAFRTRMARGRPSPEPADDPVLKAHVPALGDSLFALVVSIAFVLVGNTIDLGLGIFLVFALGMFAVALLFGVVRASALAAKKRDLATRMVSRPEAWPAIPPVPDGIRIADSDTTKAPAVPADPAGVKVSPEAEVRLRVVCAGVWVMTRFTTAVTLDGQLIGVGSLRRGFDARGGTTSGAHELQVCWGRITERFVLYLPRPGAYQAELRYSSFWGKHFPLAGED